jgi:hypothetical protein
MKTKIGWYIIEKHYRGGCSKYALRLTRKIQKMYPDWDELFDYIGENTNGGHESGYNLHANLKRTKPKNLQVLSFEPVTRIGYNNEYHTHFP